MWADTSCLVLHQMPVKCRLLLVGEFCSFPSNQRLEETLFICLAYWDDVQKVTEDGLFGD